MALLSDCTTHISSGRSLSAQGGAGLSSGATSDTPASGSQAGRDWGFSGAYFYGLEEGLQERTDTEGFGGSTAEKQSREGILKDILWPVDVGAQTFTVRVRHGGHSPTPLIRARANPDIGLNADVLMSASADTGWQLLSLSVTAAAKGVVEVWREVRAEEMGAYAFWDDASIS